MRRTVLYCAIIALCPALAFVAWRANRAQADRPDDKPTPPPQAKKLPYTRVVLFNTGLGYFQREGEVDGDTRIDMSVPASDINDILKTLVIDNGGKPASVSYEGAEPADQRLRLFAVDLTTNPTLGELLNQARGQKIEAYVEGEKGAAATQMSGTIVGMESVSDKAEFLNLNCTEGLRRVPLERVQRVRFLDSAMEDEFRRALSTLAVARTDHRRQVSVHFGGEGRRKVKFGHVAEAPLWKATYRLSLDDKRKTSLQGWGIVENMTEEDWKDVSVTLVSGRPVTFKMDLAQPLFLPRPSVEPEVYASLKPPVFAPTQTPDDEEKGEGKNDRGRMRSRGQFGGQFGSAQFGGFNGGFGGGGFNGGFGGGWNGEQQAWPVASGPTFFNRYALPPAAAPTPRLSYAELFERRKQQIERRKAAADARDAAIDLANPEAIEGLYIDADRMGRGFRYAVEPRVSLPRQRSAMLPLPANEVSAARVSVYAPAVHPRFPMLSVKLKNTGKHLMQGPVAVYDEGEYVGDARLPDMQPGQERLISYAMDLGVEVRPEQTRSKEELFTLEIVRGVAIVGTRETQTTTYRLLNRADAERTVLVEQAVSKHVLSPDGEQPAERTRQNYRFEWKIAAGETQSRAVVETTDTKAEWELAHLTTILEWLRASPKASAAVKEALAKVQQSQKGVALLGVAADRAEERVREARQDDQAARETLRLLATDTPQYRKWLVKFTDAEQRVEKHEPIAREMRSAWRKAREAHEAMVRTLNAK